MKVPILMILIWLLGSCLEFGNAFFFKALKGLKGGGGSNYGYGGYAANYGYNRGYGGYGGGYHGGYSGGYSGGYNGYGYGYGYPQQPYRTSNRYRTGRTYSDIAGVLSQDSYLGLGAGRYLPRAPYSHLWG